MYIRHRDLYYNFINDEVAQKVLRYMTNLAPYQGSDELAMKRLLRNTRNRAILQDVWEMYELRESVCLYGNHWWAVKSSPTFEVYTDAS
jgi:hypothetical protein